MAAPRHSQKPAPRRGGFPAALVIMLGASLCALPIGAATTEHVVVDRNTGLAIGGFDPVAYFTEGAPALGRGEFELRHAGAVWRFRNPGNRAAFAADPDIYMPRFGGYDPVGIGRGVTIPGDPRLWQMAGERLFLFHSPENRAAFAADSGRAVDVAEKEWPKVQRILSP
jgi:hypothetical protein